jgi:F0F1-type ATP synthase epsilon subunit
MTKKTFTLSIETPEGTLLDKAEVTSVQFKAEDGGIQVLANHTSIMTSIKYTNFEVTIDKDSSENYLCRNGIFTFNQGENSGKLIAEYCQPKLQVSAENMHSYLEFIDEQLANKGSLSQIQLVYLENEKFAVEKILAD